MTSASKHALPSRLYAIADADVFGAERLPWLVGVWAEVGVGCIQLRMKGATERELYRVGRLCKEALGESPAWFWINDSVSVARDLEATGVHLGQGDTQPSEAREHLAPDQLIGHSTHSLAQAQDADADPAVDIIALGPIFATASKANPDPVVGLAHLSLTSKAVTKPVVAIGGLDPKNCRLAIGAGARAVAVIGALRWESDAETDLGRAAAQAAESMLRQLSEVSPAKAVVPPNGLPADTGT